MSIAEQISIIVEQLPQFEQKLIFDLVSRINPDDTLTAEDIADIKQARLDYANGETVSADSLDW
ncbi:MAG: hypothetical protein FWG68_05070 [Defluviitaleaceae bacterium]|nr:hypothetical protein [Defluviitaleaceae bacterium]